MSSNISEQRPRDGRPGLGITQSVVLGRRNANSILVAAKARVDGKPSEKWEWLSTFTQNLTYGSADPDVADVSDLTDAEKEAIDLVMALIRNDTSEHGEASSSPEAGGRLRVKLTEVAAGFEAMKSLDAIVEDEDDDDDSGDDGGKGGAKPPPPDADRVVELLLEIRDVIGDRVDFANAFLSVGGLSVLLGASSERLAVPRPVRSTCLLVLSDLVTKLPPVQYTLLDHGGIRALAAMYFAEFPPKVKGESLDKVDETDGLVRARIVSAMTSAVVGHGAAERMFVTSPLARKVIESGIGMHAADETLPTPPVALRRKAVAFLEDLLVPSRGGSNSADVLKTKVEQFGPCLQYAAGNLLVVSTEPDYKVRKHALEIFRGILKQKGGSDALSIELKEQVGSAGEKRRAEIAAMDSKAMEPQEKEEHKAELYLWGKISSDLGSE